MKTKTVLVTGATGFVGRHCLGALIQRGFDVHAITSRAPAGNIPNVSQHVVDLLKPEEVSRLFSEVSPSHLLHLAWYAEHGKFWTSSKNLDWLKASIDLLQRFVENQGTRVVMVGSCAEYAWDDDFCQEESTPLKPSSLYGATKAALQSVLTSYGSQSGASTAWARLFFMYGPDEHPDKLTSSVIRSLLANQTAQCSHGTQLRDFMHVSDVARALVSLLDSSLEGPVNIGSGNPIAIRTLVEEIAAQLHKEHFVNFGALTSNVDAARIVADVSRLKKELGWEPTINLEEGLKETIEWWRQKMNDDRHTIEARGFAS